MQSTCRARVQEFDLRLISYRAVVLTLSPAFLTVRCDASHVLFSDSEALVRGALHHGPAVPSPTYLVTTTHATQPITYQPFTSPFNCYRQHGKHDALWAGTQQGYARTATLRRRLICILWLSFGSLSPCLPLT